MYDSSQTLQGILYEGWRATPGGDDGNKWSLDSSYLWDGGSDPNGYRVMVQCSGASSYCLETQYPNKYKPSEYFTQDKIPLSSSYEMTLPYWRVVQTDWPILPALPAYPWGDDR